MIKERVGVLGSGSWATALVKVLQTNGIPVNWWVREENVAKELKDTGINPRYLQNVIFDTDLINVYTDIKSVINISDVLLLVIPSSYIHSSFSEITPKMLKGKKIISAVKGIIPETNQIVANYFKTEFKMTSWSIGVISGPSHAEEIALGGLTFLTAAARNKKLGELIANMFRCHFVKIVSSRDLYGIEYAGVLKNIYAVGGGILKGLGYGDNLFASYIANCTMEMRVFIRQLHPIERIFHHSAYLGDLLVTSYSQYSRNTKFGTLVGQGKTIEQVFDEMNMVAEGYNAVKCVYEINKEYDAKTPIIDTIYNILYNGKDAQTEMQKLINMLR
ncbi:MAG: NAD(P)H-dependent glycerol-3-phosphate dehydrogenase [Bacteroidales bacterium]|jgi:glycerol-3-phosphate dehydrogenase (NAD(P)+)|nr:NAD(P)H-dependent glycerol-3-phosphate dehydrogenase [Bacteroidales bacterium]